MPSTFSRSSRAKTAFALLVFALLFAVVTTTWFRSQHRSVTAADFDDRARRSRQILETAMHFDAFSKNFVQQNQLTNSRVAQGIQSANQSIIQGLSVQHFQAVIEADLMHRNEAAKRIAKEFDNLLQAQEAMVTLNISGIDAFIDSSEPPGAKVEQPPYKIRVSNATFDAAVAVLKEAEIREVNRYSAPLAAVDAHERLKTNGIRSSLVNRNLAAPDSQPVWVHVLYVFRADEERARSLLDIPNNAAAERR